MEGEETAGGGSSDGEWESDRCIGYYDVYCGHGQSLVSAAGGPITIRTTIRHNFRDQSTDQMTPHLVASTLFLFLLLLLLLLLWAVLRSIVRTIPQLLRES